LSNTAPRHNQEPQASKHPRQSKSEKRLLREAAKEQKFNEDKEKLISIHKSIEILKTPLTNKNPINNKNPDSIMQKNMQWIADKKDNIGKWSWGISRNQIDQDFNEISSFLNSLTSNKWYEILSQRSGDHYTNHDQEVFSIENKSIDSVINYIEYLDNNDKKYLELLNQPWFNDYNIPENNKIENIKSFLYKIFE
jgi:hypothetical protein